MPRDGRPQGHDGLTRVGVDEGRLTRIPAVRDPAVSRLAVVRELAGTRVMVTGATSGLGAAMAAALSAAGARVAAISRRLARAQAAARQLGPPPAFAT